MRIDTKMKKNNILFVLFLIFICSEGCSQKTAQRSAMEEYKVVELNGSRSDMDNQLNEHAAQGWTVRTSIIPGVVVLARQK